MWKIKKSKRADNRIVHDEFKFVFRLLFASLDRLVRWNASKFLCCVCDIHRQKISTASNALNKYNDQKYYDVINFAILSYS